MQAVKGEQAKTSEALLLERCKRQSESAQMEVYDRYCKAMYNTALYILGDVFEAEDVMQEAFITAFDRLDELKDATLFRAWLKRLTVNKAVNALKKRKTYSDFVQTIENEWEEEQPSAVEATNFQVAQIKSAIESLPDGYRTIVSLYLLEGYDHEEIAEILGISSATSRSQFNRGKNKLKTLLNAHA